VFVLRRRLPDAPRTYRCGAYPIGPILFIAVVLAVDVALLCDPQGRSNALWGLGIIATGVPAYLVMNRRA
jgi:APA family basic amino acid/polyamine antiporter